MNKKLRKEKIVNKRDDRLYYINYHSQGITLVALIITIVVLVILATVSIQAITGEGIFAKAREAAFKAEMAQLQEDLGLFITNKQILNKGFSANTLNASLQGIYYETSSGVEKQEGDIEVVLPSISEKRKEQIEIIKGEILFSSQNKNELKWAQELGIGINPYNIVDGVLMSSETNLMLMGEDGVLALPTSITKIADGAFSHVEGIKKVIIPGNVKEIGENAFYGITTLEEVVIEDGVQKIGKRAFYGCTSLDNVKIPNSVTLLELQVFTNCNSLTSIALPEKLTIIPDACFGYCYKLDNVILPDSIQEIGQMAFYWCSSLETIHFPNSLRTIKTSAFARCSALKEVNLPENTTTILDSAFSMCTNLDRVFVPKSVTTIGVGCFSSTNLTEIDVAKDNPNFSSTQGILMNNSGSKMIWISSASEAIKNGIFTIPNTVTQIDAGLIKNFNEKISKVIIPELVNNIDFNFFTEYITAVEIDSKNTTYSVDDNGIYNYAKDTIYLYLGDKENIEIPKRHKNN